jgi:hypothetical protein
LKKIEIAILLTAARKTGWTKGYRVARGGIKRWTFDGNGMSRSYTSLHFWQSFQVDAYFSFQKSIPSDQRVTEELGQYLKLETWNTERK